MSNEIKNEFLNMYLEYVEDTESPRLFHKWAALSGVSACLGRRVHMPFAIHEIFGNQFILLVGPPAVKKSTAINIMKKRLMAGTSGQLRLAQDDTGGQRQGLIVAMKGEDEDEDEVDDLSAMMNNMGSIPMASIENFKFTLGSPKDKHCIYVVASEFNTFIGTNNVEMITFLAKMWDGEDYKYRIKSSSHHLTDPLVNMIGGTTPTNIVTALPPEAIGQGFMSRVILVHASEKFKSIPRPRPLCEQLAGKIEEVYRQLYTRFDGVMEETKPAADLIDDLYEYKINVNDHRFVYYAERRHMHLMKLSMTMAATRRDNQITQQDVEDAQALLVETEKHMPDALGEFGLSPLSTSKQKLVEFLQHSKVPVPQAGLWAMMQKEMKSIDFQNCMADLLNAKRIVRVPAPPGVASDQPYYLLATQKSATSQIADALIGGN